MSRLLNPAIASTSGQAFVSKPRPSINQRSKSIMMAMGGIAVAILLLGLGGAYIILQRIAATKTAVMNLEAQAGSSAQITKRYDTTLAAYNATTQELQTLEQPIAENRYVPTLLQQLQVLAQSTQLTVNSVKPASLAAETAKAAVPVAATVPPAGDSSAAATPAAKPAPPAYSTETVQLSVTGTYRQIMSFVYALPSFPKILCLKSIALSPVGAASGPQAKITASEPSLNADMTIDAYVFDQPGATTAASTAAAK